jgi:hypothetical protein
MNRSIGRWDLLGIPFIVAIGSALHFIFAWSGYRPPVALIAAVNESVWEHLKLAFWPGLFWALVEKRYLGLNAWRFWAAKGLSLLIAPLLIILIFYGYTSLIGTNLLAIDIATFVIAVTFSQLASAWLLQSQTFGSTLQRTGIVLLACQLAAFSTFTFLPPPLPLFEDSRNGTRGIPTDFERGTMHHGG